MKKREEINNTMGLKSIAPFHLKREMLLLPAKLTQCSLIQDLQFKKMYLKNLASSRGKKKNLKKKNFFNL